MGYFPISTGDRRILLDLEPSVSLTNHPVGLGPGSCAQNWLTEMESSGPAKNGLRPFLKGQTWSFETSVISVKIKVLKSTTTLVNKAGVNNYDKKSKPVNQHDFVRFVMIFESSDPLRSWIPMSDLSFGRWKKGRPSCGNVVPAISQGRMQGPYYVYSSKVSEKRWISMVEWLTNGSFTQKTNKP